MNVKDLVNKAKEIEDQTEVVVGGDYEYTPPAAGKTVARFIEYIEAGKHVEMYNGQPKKDPVEYVYLKFELLHPAKNIKEIEVEGVGKKKIAEQMVLKVTKKLNDRAKYYKLFMAMRAGRDEITHMAEMLGEAFIVDIKHNESEKDGKKTVYANLWFDGSWHVFPPIQEDALAGTKTNISSAVPEPLSPIRIFLWQVPTKETWDSLFIDGTREVKNADGTIKQESKNWLQELILSAKDFEGSALQQMLAGVDNLPTSGDKSSDKATVSQSTQEQSATANTATQGTEVKKGGLPAETKAAEENPLAALGLM